MSEGMGEFLGCVQCVQSPHFGMREEIGGGGRTRCERFLFLPDYFQIVCQLKRVSPFDRSLGGKEARNASPKDVHERAYYIVLFLAAPSHICSGLLMGLSFDVYILAPRCFSLLHHSLQFPHLLFPNFHFENTLTQHNICKSEKKTKWDLFSVMRL